MIQVLLAEDSAVTRDYLAWLLQEDRDIRVVGAARDGAEALAEAGRLRPDVILMDVHMPRLNGYEATRRIMETIPQPIVMMSASLDGDGHEMTFEALKAGALTVVEKPPGPGQSGQAEAARKLVETVKLMAEVKVVRRRRERERPRPSAPASLAARGRRSRVVALGASTGGPQAVAKILGKLPPDPEAPILVVQHIAPGFTPGMVEWLNHGTSRLPVRLGENGLMACPGTVYIAPEQAQMGIGGDGRIRLTREAADGEFCPSVSHLFETVAETYGRSGMGVLLTGMGRDGADGLKKIRDAGGITIAQDEQTSVIFGMPREAIRLGAAEFVLALDHIPQAILSLTSRRPGGV